MDLGVIIVNWNTRAHLQRCLESYLTEELDQASIVVVDQGSSDDSVMMIKNLFPGVRVCVIAENWGYAHAIHRAWPMLSNPVVVVSNADIIVHKGALIPIVGVFENDPRVGLAGCRIITSGKSATRFSRTSVRRALALELIPTGLRGKWRDIEQVLHRGTMPFEVPYVEGSFFAVRRSAFDNIGGMDEGFDFFHEDSDLSIRMTKSSYRVVHVPSAEVTHAVGASFSQVPLRRVSEMARAHILFYERHALRRALWLRRTLRLLAQLKIGLLRFPKATSGKDHGFSSDSRLQRNEVLLEALDPRERASGLAANPFVSVIIPTIDRVDCLLGLLQSLNSQSYSNFEVIVVDQSDEIGEVKQRAFDSFGDRLRLVRTTLKNRSLAKNVGIRDARGEVLLFLDDDTLAPRDLVETHVKKFSDPSVGAVSCRTLENGLPSLNSRRICTITFYGEMLANYHSDVTRFVDTLVGGNMSVRTDVQREVGYFDSGYCGTSIFEEPDFSTRLKNKGHKILFTNDTSVLHRPQPGGNDERKRNTPAQYYHDFHHNEIVYFLKNRNHLLLVLVIPFCLLRSIKQALLFRLSIHDGIHIFTGVWSGIRTYYRSLR